MTFADLAALGAATVSEEGMAPAADPDRLRVVGNKLDILIV